MASSTASSSSSSSEEENYDRTARAHLTNIGFDPEDVSKKGIGTSLLCETTPMEHFCREGNLPMVRYLISIRGADCRTTDESGRFPLFWAAVWGHLEIIKLLSRDGGAQDDIRKLTGYGCSPLRVALHKVNEYFDVVWWLLLNGALAPDDGGGIDDLVMRRDLRQDLREGLVWSYDKRLTVLAWVRDTVAAHDNVKVFLTGTIVPASSFRRHPENPYATRSKRTKVAPSPLVLLKGKSGILEVIAHYVAGTPQQRHTLRQLMDRLPAFIADEPFVEPFVEEEEDEEDEDDY